jgi:hypothetical protein
MRRVALTTEDNPFNPITDFENWYAFDERNGYHTCSYLARIAQISNEFSEQDEMDAIEDAIDEILHFNLTGNYKKVVVEQ